MSHEIGRVCTLGDTNPAPSCPIQGLPYHVGRVYSTVWVYGEGCPLFLYFYWLSHTCEFRGVLLHTCEFRGVLWGADEAGADAADGAAPAEMVGFGNLADIGFGRRRRLLSATTATGPSPGLRVRSTVWKYKNIILKKIFKLGIYSILNKNVKKRKHKLWKTKNLTNKRDGTGWTTHSSQKDVRVWTGWITENGWAGWR